MKLYSIALVAVMAAALSGCPHNGGVVTCPQAKTYSDEFLAAAANELEKIAPQAPHIVTMIGDYDVTLGAIRYCIAQARKAKKS